MVVSRILLASQDSTATGNDGKVRNESRSRQAQPGSVLAQADDLQKRKTGVLLVQFHQRMSAFLWHHMRCRHINLSMLSCPSLKGEAKSRR